MQAVVACHFWPEEIVIKTDVCIIAGDHLAFEEGEEFNFEKIRFR